MEILDLYDRERNLTGETIIRGEPVPPERYHVVIHICIFNQKGEMLVQHRSPKKANWGGLWDLSVGGAARAGDKSWQCAQRELKEELGIELDFRQIRPSLTVNFPVGFDDFYLLNLEPRLSDLTLQTDEVLAVKWADEPAILAMIEREEFLQYHPSLIKTLFAMRQSMGTLVK